MAAMSIVFCVSWDWVKTKNLSTSEGWKAEPALAEKDTDTNGQILEEPEMEL